MPAALIAGGVMAVGSIGSAYLGSKATKKAANQANQVAQDNNAANNALTRDIYNQNVNRSQPFLNTGINASNALNSYLGLGGAMRPIDGNAPITNGYQAQGGYGQQMPGYSQAGQPSGTQGTYTSGYGDSINAFSPQFTGSGGVPSSGNINFGRREIGDAGTTGYESGPGDLFVNTPNGPVSISNFAPQAQSNINAPTMQQNQPQQQIQPGQPGDPYSQYLQGGNVDAAPPETQQLSSGMIGTAMNPGSFTNFRESTGYDFRLGEGVNALSQQFASGGALNSGAAAKGLVEYGQNQGSNEYQNYLNQLNTYIQYNDNFAQNERGYQDTRGDYSRAYRQDNYNGYLDRLYNQQALGAQTNNALSGVGTNMVNAITSNNNNAANIAAQSAITRGAANNQLYNTIGNSLGNIAGGIKF